MRGGVLADSKYIAKVRKNIDVCNDMYRTRYCFCIRSGPYVDDMLLAGNKFDDVAA